jgi:hypothetical protein
MKPNHTDDVRVQNEGLHSKRQLDTIQQLFTTHDLRDAVVYHFTLTGKQEKSYYQATLKALIKHIRTKCRAEYIGAYEVGEEKNGLHAHAFVIIETSEHSPADLLDVREGGWIARRIKNKNRGHSIRIEPPKNRMHGGAMFARMNTPAKLENCINWCSYTVKARSKEGVQGRETYFGSEFASNIAKREAQRQKHRDALTKSTKKLPATLEAPAQDEQEAQRANKAISTTTNDNGAKIEQSINTLGFQISWGPVRVGGRCPHELNGNPSPPRKGRHPQVDSSDQNGFERSLSILSICRHTPSLAASNSRPDRQPVIQGSTGS